ncbi:Casein kinase I isoform gamma-1 [Sarcoptes scabiei]|uniref:non-specific serine/threonine protein kinase n=1 Tax=Sarcoptes scabiei TaxID=52283 RepID=A0A834R965_SARSC|nr:Casein kinase I isoform gamma-1 [Sarcoptes scabiei]
MVAHVDSTKLISERVGNSSFIIGNYLTGGSFGSLHAGHHSKTKEKVAIKVERQDCAKPQLHLEYGFYRTLGSNMNFLPKILYFGPCRNYNALVMDLLGPSLLKMNQICDNHFGIVTTTKLLIQLLNIFEYVHDQGIIYRDIKPDNFLFGQPKSPKWSTLHMIDLGFCKRYITEEHQHIAFVEGKGVTGTARYISINNHLGRELSRRDDLEAIVYMMIFLHKGQLPWQGLQGQDFRERTKRIGLMKMSIPIEKLCEEMPKEYQDLLETVRKFRFEERPLYRKWMSRFTHLLIKMGIEFRDEHYDWDQNHNHLPQAQRF